MKFLTQGNESTENVTVVVANGTSVSLVPHDVSDGGTVAPFSVVTFVDEATAAVTPDGSVSSPWSDASSAWAANAFTLWLMGSTFGAGPITLPDGQVASFFGNQTAGVDNSPVPAIVLGTNGVLGLFGVTTFDQVTETSSGVAARVVYEGRSSESISAGETTFGGAVLANATLRVTNANLINGTLVPGQSMRNVNLLAEVQGQDVELSNCRNVATSDGVVCTQSLTMRGCEFRAGPLSGDTVVVDSCAFGNGIAAVDLSATTSGRMTNTVFDGSTFAPTLTGNWLVDSVSWNSFVAAGGTVSSGVVTLIDPPLLTGWMWFSNKGIADGDFGLPWDIFINGAEDTAMLQPPAPRALQAVGIRITDVDGTAPADVTVTVTNNAVDTPVTTSLLAGGKSATSPPGVVGAFAAADPFGVRFSALGGAFAHRVWVSVDVVCPQVFP